MSKLFTLGVGAAAYVLGTRAGREQYVQIKEQAERLWSNPKVQQAKAQATDAASQATAAGKNKVAQKKSEAETNGQPTPSSQTSTAKHTATSQSGTAQSGKQSYTGPAKDKSTVDSDAVGGLGGGDRPTGTKPVTGNGA